MSKFNNILVFSICLLMLLISAALSEAETFTLGNQFISNGKYKAQWYGSRDIHPTLGEIYSEILIEADCARGVFRTIAGQVYKDNKVIERVKFYQPWTVAKPNTRYYNWYSNICSH